MYAVGFCGNVNRKPIPGQFVTLVRVSTGAHVEPSLDPARMKDDGPSTGYMATVQSWYWKMEMGYGS